MALVKSGTFGSSPSAYYEIHADLLGGSGNTRQVKVHLALKVNGSSSSHYGYPLSWLPKIHTSNGGWQYVKDGTSWNGSQGLRWYNWTATVDVGTTSSTSISVGFDLKRSDGGSSSWNTSQSGSFNVGSTNTAPSMNGSVTIRNGSASGSVLTGIIPENVSTLHLSWSAGSDNEQGSSGLKYGVNQIINGGGATTILYPTTSTSCTAGIGAGNEGQRLKYYVDCRDNSDVLSGNRANSVEITKNTFTGDTLASSSSIKYTDANSSISFTYSGAKNTGSSTKFTRVLTCDGITVHGTLPASPATVTIYRSGATPGGAYIKFDDIKNKFKNNNYQGTLVFTLKTTNEYGTARTSSKSISVDLRANPNPAKGHEISTTTTESTIYKKVASSNSHYFLPDGSGVARVKWSAGSGKLGEAISYEIFVAYGSGSWQKVADVASGTLYYNHKIPKQTVSQQFKYLIRTKTSYGWYSDAITPTQTLHYHNPPSILVGQISRTETTAEIPVTIKSLTSIPNVAISGSWSGKGSGDLSTSQTEQKINITGLTGSGTYTITVTYNDNTGFSGNQTKAIAVGANLSIIFVNQYGLGVGGAKATSNNSFVATGNPLIQGSAPEIKIKSNTGTNSSRLVFDRNSAASWDLYSHNGPLKIRCNYTDKAGDFYDAVTVAHNTGNVWCKGLLNAVGGLQVNGSSVYHTGNKPTPAAISAVATADVSEANSASKIPKRNSSGDIHSRLFRSEYGNQNTISGAIAYRINNSNDNYIRFCSDTGAIRKWLDVGRAITNTQAASANNNRGLREGILDLGNGLGIMYNYVTVTTNGGGGIQPRDADLASSVASKLTACISSQMTCTFEDSGGTWGYVIGGYDQGTKRIFINGGDFNHNSGINSKVIITAIVGLNTGREAYRGAPEFYLNINPESKERYAYSEDPTSYWVDSAVVDKLAEITKEKNVHYIGPILPEEEWIEIYLEDFDEYFEIQEPPQRATVLSLACEDEVGEKIKDYLLRENKELKERLKLIEEKLAL